VTETIDQTIVPLQIVRAALERELRTIEQLDRIGDEGDDAASFHDRFLIYSLTADLCLDVILRVSVALEKYNVVGERLGRGKQSSVRSC
jgi:hypothetical protein